MVFELEDGRKHRMHDLATLIQKVYRGWSQWNKVGWARKMRWKG